MTRFSLLRPLAVASCAAALALIQPATLPGPPHGSKYTYGIDTYFEWDCRVSPSQVEAWAATEAAEFKELGANWIGVGFPLYTNSITSNYVYTKCVDGSTAYQSPTPAILGDVVRADHAAGLKVLLRPLISQTNLRRWRGNIAPADPSKWFTSYMSAIRPYLVMAATDKVEAFAIMTELDVLASNRQWNVVRQRSRLYYKRDLVWDFSWKWDATKVHLSGASFAMDAYPDLPSVSNTADPAQIADAWDNLLKQKSYYTARLGATTIDEVDIPAQDGAQADSSDFTIPLSSHPFNQLVQANWIAGACLFMKYHHMQGIFVWGPFLSTDQGRLLTRPDPARSTNIQPRTQRAIRHCF